MIVATVHFLLALSIKLYDSSDVYYEGFHVAFHQVGGWRQLRAGTSEQEAKLAGLTELRNFVLERDGNFKLNASQTALVQNLLNGSGDAQAKKEKKKKKKAGSDRGRGDSGESVGQAGGGEHEDEVGLALGIISSFRRPLPPPPSLLPLSRSLSLPFPAL